MAEDPGSTIIRTNKGGTAEFGLGKPAVTQKEIDAHLQEITEDLNAIYQNLVNGMESFQQRWDACGKSWAEKLKQLDKEKREGAEDGLSEWADDFGDMFTPETWKEVYRWVKEAGISAGNRLSKFANWRHTVIKKLLELGNSYSWLDFDADSGIPSNTLLTMYPRLPDDTAFKTNALLKIKEIWEHREEIAKLPEILSSADAVGYVKFTDTVVEKIDPALAAEIRKAEEANLFLELMADPDSVLTHKKYSAMIFKATPPNFYAYTFGKTGAYVSLELVFSASLALLSGGAGAAARAAALTGRLGAAAKAASLAASATKNVARAQRLRKAAVALEAFTNTLLGLYRVAQKFRKHALMLVAARRGLSLFAPSETGTSTGAGSDADAETERLLERLKGKTELETDPQPGAKPKAPPVVPVQRTMEKRPKGGCEICGSTTHETPNYGGTLERNGTAYKKTIESNTMEETHPRHQGVKMAAHHVISITGARDLKEQIKADLVRLGYNINILSNLAFIPNTLKGACHLEVQPHVSSHNLQNAAGEVIYHEYVWKTVSELALAIKKCCPTKVAVEKVMEGASDWILYQIQNFPVQAPLSSGAQHFVPSNMKGCGNVERVGDHKGDKCRLNFNHLSPEGTPGITYPKQPYTLKLGK